MPLRLLAAILALSAAALSLAWPDSPERHVRPLERPQSDSGAVFVSTPPEIATAQFLAYADGVAVRAYLDALEAARLEAEAAEAARLEALRAASAQRPTSTYHPGSTVGECTGFAVPDYIIQRESGGNPSAYNPSGAYGCAQTLLSHYSSGSCQGLDPYTIDGQRQCVWILSNGGTNLQPWSTR